MAILVIRSDDKFSRTLRDAGLDVINLELIETKPLEDLSDLRSKIENLSEYDGVFFTSPVAAEIFVRERNGSNKFHGSIYALGHRAVNVLESAGLNVKAPVDANIAEEMLNEFGDDEFAGKRLLFVRGVRSLRTIPESLSGVAKVDEVAVYSTVPANIGRDMIENIRSQISEAGFDFVCFFSPSGVERFAQLFEDALMNIKAAAIGNTTAEAARKAGFKTDYISPRSNAEDFAEGLIDHIKDID